MASWLLQVIAADLECNQVLKQMSHVMKLVSSFRERKMQLMPCTEGPDACALLKFGT